MAKATRMAPRYRDLPLGKDAAAVRRRIEGLEKILERGFTVPGTKQTFGLDFILGLIPVGGDVIAATMGLYIVWEARNLGMPKTAMMRMLANVGFDTVLGAVPLVGDAADFFFRSNSRNLRIIRKHLDKHHPGTVTINPK